MTEQPEEARLVHDWATTGSHAFARPARRVAVNDETLRDGLQSPSAIDPPLETKIRLVHLMDALAIEAASFGIPAAGPRQQETVLRLCREVETGGLNLRPNCGGRTLVSDVRHIVDIAQRVGFQLEACLFVGSSPIRRYVEDWDEAHLVKNTRDAVGFAASEGLRVTFITEDTTRSRPEHLRTLFSAAIEAGAHRICLCDTAGAAIPEGVMNLVEWVGALLRELGANEVEIDWHGHEDRGFGVANTIAAMQAGATRLHGTALGIGERVGNAPTEAILVNLRLLGVRDTDLTPLQEYVETVADALGIPIPPGSPIVGRDAFRTASGVHAAAQVRAEEKGDAWLAERIYSSVPASWLGRRNEVEIGPLAGKSNVRYFLRARSIAEAPELIEAILAAAKRSDRVLLEEEILRVIQEHESR